MKKICIVTPDIIGVVTNGGVGTACYWLSMLYAQLPDCEVTVFYTSPIYQKLSHSFSECFIDKDQVVKDFLTKKIKIEFVDDLPNSDYPRYPYDDLLRISDEVFHYCLNHNFDVIHFQDLNACGFRTIQAKTSGLAFQETLLTLTMHSPLTWMRQGMNDFPQNPRTESRLDYATQYVVRHADLLISPSQYMFNWAKSENWKLANKQHVIPNLLESSLEKGLISIDDNIDFSHLVFFGRLETRKGLEIFCQSILHFCSTNPMHGIKKITFLGRDNRIGSRVSSSYLTDFVNSVSRFDIQVKNIYDYDAFEALQYIKDSRAIAVMPSLLDNYPYTILECMQHKIPFLASCVGGVPEMVCRDILFEPNIEGLTAAIASRHHSMNNIECNYSLHEAQIKWQDMLYLPTATYDKTIENKKTVSICIAHFNHGKYLPQLLESILANDYPHIEVVVVDDASTCNDSRKIFKEQKLRYAHLNWQFIEKEQNDYLGATRNQAVAASCSDYVIIMDADNLAKPTMVSDFVRGMQTSGADCLTCYFEAFVGDSPPLENSKPMYTYEPYGASLEMGLVENAFGDANCCIKRDVFMAIGGFSTDRNKSFEDWEMFGKIVLAGFYLDVIPKSLFWYRHIAESVSRATNLIVNTKRASRVYLQNKSWNLEKVIYHLLIPLNSEIYVNDKVLLGIVKNMQKLVQSLNKSKEFLRKSQNYAADLHARFQSLSADLELLQAQKMHLSEGINPPTCEIFNQITP